MQTGASASRWLVPPKKSFALAERDPSSTGGAPGGRRETERASAALNEELAVLQERLWAEHRQSLLVVLQAMDAGGKDGTIKKVFSGINPQGCRVTGFKAPNDVELAHDFLWRIHRHTPGSGEIAIFNRSHYEDVLIVRVRDLVPKDIWTKRYARINDFEAGLASHGTRIVKLFLHITKDEQADRLRKRLADPAKQWKFRKRDLDERALWADYQEAYEAALGRTSTATAPWFVIPANAKWYRDWAVLTVLVETLRDMAPEYPTPEGDLAGVVVV